MWQVYIGICANKLVFYCSVLLRHSRFWLNSSTLPWEQSQTHLQYAAFSLWTRWPWHGSGDYWQAFHRGGSNSLPGQPVCSVVKTETLGQVPLPVFHFSPTTLIPPLLPVHIPLITNDPIIKAVDSIHFVVCLTRGQYLLPKRIFHRLRSSASSFNLQLPLFFLKIIQWLLMISSSSSRLFLPLSFLELRVLGSFSYERYDQSS